MCHSNQCRYARASSGVTDCISDVLDITVQSAAHSLTLDRFKFSMTDMIAIKEQALTVCLICDIEGIDYVSVPIHPLQPQRRNLHAQPEIPNLFMDYSNSGYLLDFGDLRDQVNPDGSVFNGRNNGHYYDCDTATPKFCGIDYLSCKDEV
jgi:hypothetical protein